MQTFAVRRRNAELFLDFLSTFLHQNVSLCIPVYYTNYL